MPKFTTAQDSTMNNGVKILAHGDSGVGKTVLSATLPNPVLLSAESGALSIRTENLIRLYGPNDPTITYNMPMILIENIDDLVDAYNWCTKSAEARQFQSVGLDSLTEIAEVVLNNAKKLVKDPRQAYGELITKMENTVRLFRDLPQKHVYMSAKTEPLKDELTGVVKYSPSMPGTKLGPKLPYFFDEVFFVGVNNTPQHGKYRFLQTQPDLQRVAKDRSGALAEMEAPHLTHVINKILGVSQNG